MGAPRRNDAGLRLMAAAAAASVALLLCAHQAHAQTVTGTVSFSFVASTAPSGVTALYGVNSASNNDLSAYTWLQRLGATGVRIFGLSSVTTSLHSFVVNGANGTWGADLNGAAITAKAGYTSAVTQLRSTAGHTPGAAGFAAWTNPPAITYLEAQNGPASASTAPDGLDLATQVSKLQAMGVEPLLPFVLTCNMFSFSTLDSNNATYWQEHWELYKHTYIAARWAYMHGVRKLEFWNEPDSAVAKCVTAYSWLEYYTLQATAIRNAFSDLNADVSNTVIACPAVPGMGAPCPLSPRIYASAFSQATFGPGVNTAGSTQYSALYPADSYPYLGSLTVQFEHLTFPPNGAPTASNSSLGSGTQSASQQNLDAFSVHSYGKTGAGLSSLGSSTALAIATLRAENTITPTLPVIPYAVTEHAAHTTATFNNISTTGDTPFEASRLAAQMLFQVVGGWETYIFKMSTLEQSSTITAGCTKNATASGVGTPCGIQKTGLLWAEIAYAPFAIGDSTLMGEAAGLIMRVAGTAGRTLETITPAVGTQGGAVVSGGVGNPYYTSGITTSPKYPGFNIPPIAVVNDGRRRVLMFVNEGSNPTDASNAAYVPVPATFTIDVSAWGLPPGTNLVYTVVGAGSSSEVAGLLQASPAGVLTIPNVPPYTLCTVSAPMGPQLDLLVPTSANAVVSAGNAANTAAGPSTTMSIATTVNGDAGTTAALLAFNMAHAPPPSQLLTAMLELTVAAPAPASSTSLTIVAWCNQSWADTTVTWASAGWALTPTAPPLTTIAANFQRTDTGAMIAGHVTLAAGTPAGTVKRVEVTEAVRACGAGTLTLVLARRVRNSAYAGNAGGAIPADNLSNGAAAVFAASQAPQGAPALHLMLAAQPVSFQVSASGAASLAGRRRLLAAGDPVAVANSTTSRAIVSALGSAVGGAAADLTLTGYYVTTQVQLKPFTSKKWDINVQRAFEVGLARDCGLTPVNVLLANFVPGTGDSLLVPVQLGPFTSGASTGLDGALQCVGALTTDTGGGLAGALAEAGLNGASASVTGTALQRSLSAGVVAGGVDDKQVIVRTLDNAIASGTFENHMNRQGVMEKAARCEHFSTDAERLQHSGAVTAAPPTGTPPVRKKLPPPPPKKTAHKPPPAGGRRLAA